MIRCILLMVLIVIVVGPAAAQDKADEKAPFPFQEAPEKKDWKWDEDDRFNELMEQLAINEASLDAVDAAIAKKTRKKGSQLGAVKRNEENNRMMDRKGGGPMKWNEFYGTNAEKFFYHPVDPNTSYYTATALRQMGKAEDDKRGSDVPSTQCLPVHQRPPQWDYIYRANRTASESAMADAALLSTEVQQLEQRRGQLEQEQAVLWCKLAFRAVQRLDVHRKELLQCQLIAAGDGTGQVEQARALAAAAQFLSSALLIVEKAEEDQSFAMGSAKSVVVEARERFEDQLREQTTLKQESRNKENSLGQFAALAKLLGDKSKTLSEAYQGAVDGAANNEIARKDSYRGMLQRTVIDYAQILLALNELCDGMQKEWGVSVDTKSKVVTTDVAWSTVTPPQNAEATTASARPPSPPKAEGPRSLIAKASLKGWHLTEPGGNPNWLVKNGVLTCMGQGASLATDESFGDLDMHVEFLLPAKCNSGIFLQGHYEVQLIDSDFGALRPDQMCGAIYGLHPGMQAVYVGPNKWNSLDVGLRGQSVTVKMNGKTIVSEAVLTQATQAAPDTRVGAPGPIVVQAYGGGKNSTVGAAFRNFTITPIK